MNDELLIAAAADVRSHAYAPFSVYAVGAAVLDAEGRIFAGCNVENASFGASMCAERAAIFKMVSEGGQRIAKLAVVTEDGAAPCGMCLQVVREFAGDPGKVEILCKASAGNTKRYLLRELLP